MTKIQLQRLALFPIALVKILGNGYSTETVKAVLQYGADEIGYNNIAIFFQNRLFKPFFRLCISQKSLRILFLLITANSYEELRPLH